jgi:hypothetical protein
MSSDQESIFVAVFNDAKAFTRALESLVENGFTQSEISILGNHQDIVDHFGSIPAVDELADRADTPRESLDAHVSVRGVIDFLSETLAVVAELGTAAAAYAVGGPIGVASGASEQTDATVGGFLSRFADEHWQHRLEQSIRDGGIVCWVHASDAAAAGRAARVLDEAGGDHIHRIDPFPGAVLPID